MQSISAQERIDELNQRLPRYEVVGEVGHGAMGVVYEARQEGVGRRVALKVLPANLALRERTVRRFLREAASMGRLSHSQIVDIYEVESLGSLHYFAMQFVEGPPLDLVLSAGPLAIRDVVQIGIDVSEALAHAHGRGVMHRDIKPANLLRNGDRVVLTDFGLARPLDGHETGTMTESGDLVGTPLYMSPEQIAGDTGRIDGRCDLWGLGVTLYELLTQRSPFAGPSAQAILNTILHKDPPLLRRYRDDIPPDLEAVVLKALEKDPGRRYSGAAAMLEDLVAVRDGGAISARAPRLFDPCVRWVRRHKHQTVVAGFLIALMAAFGWAARKSSQRLSSVREELTSTQTAAEEAQKEQERLKPIRTASNAEKELLQARLQLATAGDNSMRRREAVNRILFLLDAFPPEEYPRIACSAVETYAAWGHEEGRDAEVIASLETLLFQDESRTTLALRAAMLTGLERFKEALRTHRSCTRQSPENPVPYLDAGRILQNMASAVDPEDLDERKLLLLRGLHLHSSGLALAGQVGDGETAIELLIERARCYIALELYDSANRDLRVVQTRDETRADALALLFAAERQATIERTREAVRSEPTPAPSPAPEDAIEMAATPEIDTRDIEDAGQGLRLIFEGLRDVFGSSTEGEAEPAASEPQDP